MNLILIPVLLFLLLSCIYLFCLKPNTHRNQKMLPFEQTYIAHRGFFDNAADWPENSLAAFQRAVTEGYGIELDVQLTKDSKLVVFHDGSLKRMCGVDKKLTACTYKELQTCFLAQSSQHIPLLSDVLKLVNGQVPLVIEIKREGNAIKTARQLSHIMAGYKGVYCIESFHPRVVAWYRKFQPSVVRGQLSSDFKKEGTKCNSLIAFILTNLLLNWYGKPDFIAYNHRYASQFSYRLCRRLYPAVHAGWTIRSQDELSTADGIFDIIIFDGFRPKPNTPQP